MLNFIKRTKARQQLQLKRSFRMLDAACQIIIPLARDHLSTLGDKLALVVVSVIVSLIWDEELILTNLFCASNAD
jgi:hypothetical protein